MYIKNTIRWYIAIIKSVLFFSFFISLYIGKNNVYRITLNFEQTKIWGNFNGKKKIQRGFLRGNPRPLAGFPPQLIISTELLTFAVLPTTRISRKLAFNRPPLTSEFFAAGTSVAVPLLVLLLLFALLPMLLLALLPLLLLAALPFSLRLTLSSMLALLVLFGPLLLLALSLPQSLLPLLLLRLLFEALLLLVFSVLFTLSLLLLLLLLFALLPLLLLALGALLVPPMRPRTKMAAPPAGRRYSGGRPAPLQSYFNTSTTN